MRVPPHFAREFHRTLEPRYASSPERLRYVEYEGVGHDVPDLVGDQIRRAMVEWFARHLVS